MINNVQILILCLSYFISTVTFGIIWHLQEKKSYQNDPSEIWSFWNFLILPKLTQWWLLSQRETGLKIWVGWVSRHHRKTRPQMAMAMVINLYKPSVILNQIQPQLGNQLLFIFKIAVKLDAMNMRFHMEMLLYLKLFQLSMTPKLVSKHYNSLVLWHHYMWVLHITLHDKITQIIGQDNSNLTWERGLLKNRV